MNVAIYIRQSKEKEDSLSLESQEKLCISICESNGWQYTIFEDAGESGGDVERDDFQDMLYRIISGEFQHMMIYRLDRLNRDVPDFADLLRTLERHDATFQSATEQFDTSTPFGRAVAYIIMALAEYERRMTAARFKENYFYRAKKGHYPGGSTPFGYVLDRMLYEGKMATTLDIDPVTDPILLRIYKEHTVYGYSLREIATRLSSEGLKTGYGKPWSAQAIRRILRNPLYVENTIDIYEYFVGLGTSIANKPEEFDGTHGCLLLGKEIGRKHRKMTDLSNQILAIGLHPPRIPADQWLLSQRLLARNRQTKRKGTGHLSWLTGLVSCAHCGYAITVKGWKKKNKEYYYLTCRGRTNLGAATCKAKTMHPLREVEKEIERQLLDHVHEIDLSNTAGLQKDPVVASEINRLKGQDIQLTKEIDALIDLGLDGAAKDYIQKKINKKDAQRKDIQASIQALSVESPVRNVSQVQDAIDRIKTTWADLGVRERHNLAEILIKGITISMDQTIDITWVF